MIRSVPWVAGCWGPMLRVMPSVSSSTLRRASAACPAMYASCWRSDSRSVMLVLRCERAPAAACVAGTPSASHDDSSSSAGVEAGRAGRRLAVEPDVGDDGLEALAAGHVEPAGGRVGLDRMVGGGCRRGGRPCCQARTGPRRRPPGCRATTPVRGLGGRGGDVGALLRRRLDIADASAGGLGVRAGLVGSSPGSAGGPRASGRQAPRPAARPRVWDRRAPRASVDRLGLGGRLLIGRVLLAAVGHVGRVGGLLGGRRGLGLGRRFGGGGGVGDGLAASSWPRPSPASRRPRR